MGTEGMTILTSWAVGSNRLPDYLGHIRLRIYILLGSCVASSRLLDSGEKLSALGLAGQATSGYSGFRDC